MEKDLRLTVGVCESPAELAAGSAAWRELCRTVSREAPDLFLLNEMPFGSWISAAETFDAATWRRSLALHEEGLQRLHELGAAVVAGSRPREVEGRRVNEGFLWTRAGGVQAVHTKQYFPDEEGYFEARWFQAGPRHFHLAEAASLQVGFLICTELMFNEHARSYGRRGAHVILVPRAVGPHSLGRWLVGARMAAIVSGSYVLSSNRAGTDAQSQEFGGTGWIIDPHGDVVTETSPSTPVVFHEIDLGVVHQAQSEYPCYVADPEVPVRRQVTWDWADRPGLEALSLERSESGVFAEGTVIAEPDGETMRAHYRIAHDVAWRFREALIETGPVGSTSELRIRLLEDGRWEVDGTVRPDLEGCQDVDLMVTPYTNTPPLAAHPLAPSESRRSRVAWVLFPDLEIRAVEQEYTRLDAGDGTARYRYRNLDSGFVGELTVDEDGLVLNYGPWRQR